MAGKPKLNQKAIKAIDREIARYLKTSDYDEYHSAWHLYSYLDRAEEMGRRIEDTLVAEVQKRDDGQTSHKLPKRFNAKVFARKKVPPCSPTFFRQRNARRFSTCSKTPWYF